MLRCSKNMKKNPSWYVIRSRRFSRKELSNFVRLRPQLDHEPDVRELADVGEWQARGSRRSLTGGYRERDPSDLLDARVYTIAQNKSGPVPAGGGLVPALVGSGTSGAPRSFLGDERPAPDEPHQDHGTSCHCSEEPKPSAQGHKFCSLRTGFAGQTAGSGANQGS